MSVAMPSRRTNTVDLNQAPPLSDDEDFETGCHRVPLDSYSWNDVKLVSFEIGSVVKVNMKLKENVKLIAYIGK